MISTGLILLLIVAVVSCEEGPIVNIQQGRLQGTFMVSRYGRRFFAFQGIPYAQPPVGDLRFKEPVNPEPWKGTWYASAPGSICLQKNRVHPRNYGIQDPLTGDENCLFLNVYTPKLPSYDGSQDLEVFVYFHGGAWQYGWGHEYGPKILMDRDAVLVTVTYRLGPLGFLSTGDDIVPGNMGLKDQSAALRWVKNNIAAFGGNPNSVTITGTSAGGASAHYHFLSEWSKGLFNRGISQSGSSLCPWTQMEDGPAKARKLGAFLGCDDGNSRELVDCLRNRPARQIVEQVKHFQVWMYNPFSPFGPTVETAGSNPFLTKHPVDLLLEGKVHDVPWITSATTEDGLYPAADWVGNEKTLEELNERFDELAPFIFDYNYTVSADRKKYVVARIRDHYLQGRPVTPETTQEIIQMCTDRLFLLPGAQSAKLQAAVNKSPVYFYLFGYRGKHSFSEIMSGTTTNFGVSHLDDTGYIFDFDFKTDETEEDRNMSELLLDIWMAFAKTENPVPKSRNFNWDATESNEKDLRFLFIKSPSKFEMMKNDNLGNQKFWDSLPIDERQIGKTTPIDMRHEEL
ncbi:venom carboxylesterase-6-like [Zootermopsis nevadensis]|uniref:Carboxylic ester hydrolase n=1 Tax=Zootermopsis nevadensis TaxID=136037 RepID=A0A067QFP9_ZOONE|nr:venom carboxylesterase-6-like [Zootermopsis nevadensis]KDR06604.1 Esterase FE4 [Zootermopsis nevadensis]